MHPVLFTIGPMPISSFGVLLVLGYIIGVFYVFQTARDEIAFIRTNLTEEKIFDLIILTTLAGFLGARLSYIILHFPDFGFDLLKWALFTYFPGLHILGAILAVLLFLFLFTRGKKYPSLLLLDYIVLGFLLAAPFGYVGNFFSERISQFPLQLVDAGIMAVFFIFFFLAKQKRMIKEEGIISLTFLAIFAIVSCGFEFLRTDRTYLAFFTYRQLLGLALFLISVGTLAILHKGEIVAFLRKYNLLW